MQEAVHWCFLASRVGGLSLGGFEGRQTLMLYCITCHILCLIASSWLIRGLQAEKPLSDGAVQTA